VFNSAAICLLVAGNLINQIEISAYEPAVTSEVTWHYLCNAGSMGYSVQGTNGNLENIDMMQIEVIFI
jgi:hypothetical protein